MFINQCKNKATITDMLNIMVASLNGCQLTIVSKGTCVHTQQSGRVVLVVYLFFVVFVVFVFAWWYIKLFNCYVSMTETIAFIVTLMQYTIIFSSVAMSIIILTVANKKFQ